VKTYGRGSTLSQHKVFVDLRRKCAREKAWELHLKEERRHAPRDPWQAREKAAIIIWRKHGYSMSHLAAVFHRSLSSIHGILKKAERLGAVALRDYRKLPSNLRRRANALRRSMMENYMKQWLDWIAGVEGKPP
jgi:hypothetical protein